MHRRQETPAKWTQKWKNVPFLYGERVPPFSAAHWFATDAVISNARGPCTSGVSASRTFWSRSRLSAAEPSGWWPLGRACHRQCLLNIDVHMDTHALHPIERKSRLAWRGANWDFHGQMLEKCLLTRAANYRRLIGTSSKQAGWWLNQFNHSTTP